MEKTVKFGLFPLLLLEITTIIIINKDGDKDNYIA
jgi:hypothetical protein